MFEQDVQKSKYFEYRKISYNFYKNYKLPAYIKFELRDKNAKILDFGCGYGQNLFALRSLGFTNIYGVDIEKSAIKFLTKCGFNIKEVDQNPERLENPFPFKFDIILLLHVLEHFPKDKIIYTLRVIKEKFLESGGVLLIAVPNAQSRTGFYWAYEDFTHTTIFTSGSIFFVLKAAGFEEIEFLDIDCTMGSSKYKAIIRKLLLKLYKINNALWNKVTCSSYHQPSPQIFSYEIKVKAK